MHELAAASRGLAANLVSGARLAVFLPVARPRFHIDSGQLVLVAVASALVDLFADWVREPAGAVLDWAGFGAELSSLALLVAIAALGAWRMRDPPLLVALPVIVLASLPVVQVANLLPWRLGELQEEESSFADAAYWMVLAWFLAVLARSAFVALQPGRVRVARAGVLAAMLALPLALPADVLPQGSWWTAPSIGADMQPTNPASEAVLMMQRELQDDALGTLTDHAQGETQLYFVAFAPDGAGSVWRGRLDKAREVMDAHWDTSGRSLVYVNDASSLTETPMATITFLREALEEIAAASNPDEDIVMLYLAGRSNPDGSLRVSLPPLGLVQLSGPALAYLLKEAGIKWRVVVVAACDAQPFVNALADADSLVIGAASPSCARGGEPTELGDALFGESLAGASSLAGAIENAHRRLAERGAVPTVRMGEAIAPQLARLRSGSSRRAALLRPPAG